MYITCSKTLSSFYGILVTKMTVITCSIIFICTCIWLFNCSHILYVGLSGSGLFNFIASQSCFLCFFSFDILYYSFIMYAIDRPSDIRQNPFRNYTVSEARNEDEETSVIQLLDNVFGVKHLFVRESYEHL